MRNRSTHWMLLVALVALAHVPRAASGQIKGGPIDIQLFRPAIDSKGYITLNSSQVLRHLDVSFGLVVNFARRPLNFTGPTLGGPWCFEDGSGKCLPGGANVYESRYKIDNLVTGNLQAALGLFKHFEIGLGLPITIWNGDTQPNPSTNNSGKIDAQGAGDLGLHFKGRILNTSRHPVGLGMVLSFTFPTGDKEAFLGSGRFGIAPTVLIDKEFFDGRLSLAANIGARFLSGTRSWTDTRDCEPQFANLYPNKSCGTNHTIENNHHLTYGIGASVYLVPQRLSAVAEIIGQTGFSGFADASKYNSAHEILAGFKLYLARNSYFAIGAGRGLRGGGTNYQYGSPDVRVFGAFIFEPSIGDRDGDGIKDDVDKCPDDPEDFDDFEDEDGCPDPDNDRDGIKDKDDKCPNEPENYNGFEDTDGCPDMQVLDRDGDGIPDDKDKCPDDPEDKDGFEDEDGCPDPDNDRDGIPDVDDLCPDEPEDKDGFEDEDGCPDPDNDKDGVPDKDDRCPNEPETKNGFEDEDGCPDKVPFRRTRGGGFVLDKVYFETDKAVILPRSFSTLDAVVRALEDEPHLLLVEIQGHADERGSAEHNLKLTDDRAHAVMGYMRAKGVAPGRLRAKGYGETRPVDRRHIEEAWSKNRRVEFVVLRRSS